MSVLEVKNLEKHFDRTKVLNDISFTLEKGQALSIIGSSGSGKTTLLSGTLSDEFHVYAAEWTDAEIIWFLDGREYYRTQLTEDNKKYFTEPHRVLLSLAVGGDWPGAPDETTVFPQRYVIDWVRVYQK